MNAAGLIQAVQAAGGTIRADGQKLKLSAPQPLADDLLAAIKAQKADLLKALQDERPLAAKLRAYGRPFPLTVGGEVKCWLVPDAATAKDTRADEPIYTAEEAEYLATLPPADVLNLHAAKSAFGGTVQKPAPEAGYGNSTRNASVARTFPR